MQEDKIGNSRMVQNGKKTRSAQESTTAVCPEGPVDDGKRLDSLSPHWTLNCDRYFRFI